MKRLLGLDIGRVRIGVALSDPLAITAQPLEVIVRKHQEPLARLRALVAEYGVEGVVVGLPLNLAGERAQAVQGLAAFVEQLRRALGIPIIEWDERLTTRQAERVMIAQGAGRETRKQHIDKIAAAILLQSYLDQR